MRRAAGVCILAGVFLACGCAFRGTPEPVPFGHFAALSGPNRSAGERAEHGILLAVEEARQGTERRVIVYHADTHGEADLARAEAVRLLAVRHVAGLFGVAPAEGLERIARAVQPSGVPLVLLEQALVPPAEPVFSLIASPAFQGEVLARFARDELKVSKVGVLTDSRSPAAAALAAAFTQELSSEGKGVRVESWRRDGETDLAELVKRIKEASPAAVLLAGPGSEVAALRTQMQADGLEVPLLTAGGEDEPPVVEGPGPVVYRATVFAPEGLTDAGKDLARRYRERFSQDLDAHAALAYDGTQLLTEAVRRVRSSGSSKLRDEVAKVEGFESVTGPLSFDKERNARRPLFVMRLDGSQARLARRFDPPAK